MSTIQSLLGRTYNHAVLRSHAPPDYECRFERILRLDDHKSAHAPPLPGQGTTEEETDPVRDIHHWYVQCKSALASLRVSLHADSRTLIDVTKIVAAVLNKFYSFTNPFGTEWTEWYLRESYTAILCANLPLTYPLIQRVFGLKSWSHNSYGSEYFTGSRTRQITRTGLRSQHKSTMITMNNMPQDGISKTVSVNVTNSYGGPGLNHTESQERINVPNVPKVYAENDFGQTAWISGGTDLYEIKKSGSSTSSRSLNSVEDTHSR